MRMPNANEIAATLLGITGTLGVQQVSPSPVPADPKVQVMAVKHAKETDILARDLSRAESDRDAYARLVGKLGEKFPDVRQFLTDNRDMLQGLTE